MESEISDFLDFLSRDRDRASNTTDRYRQLLGRFSAFACTSLSQAAVTPADIDRRLVALFVRHGGRPDGPAAAPSTRNVRLAALRGFTTYLVSQGQLAADPTAGLRSARVKSRSPGFLTEPEFGRLLAAVSKTTTEHYAIRDEAILTVLFHCGLRVSELLSLTLPQVNLEALRFHAVPRKGRIVEDVVMNQTAAEALRRWLLYRKSYRRAEETDALFLSDQSRPLSVRALERNFACYSKAAGFAERHLTPHGLRHSCATALIAHGVPLTTVSAVLAHQSIETTRLYIRLAGREKLEALARLDPAPRARNPKKRIPESRNSLALTGISDGAQSDANCSRKRASSNNAERFVA